MNCSMSIPPYFYFSNNKKLIFRVGTEIVIDLK
jgi:hypothetical protein